jgi:hypothetical protein
MVLSIYNITLLKGFVRKTFNIGECTICYESASLFSLHKGENIHGICRECIGSYNKTVCHMCRNPIPEEILTRWNIQEEILNQWDIQDYLQGMLTAEQSNTEASVTFFQVRVVQAMDSLLEGWDTHTSNDIDAVLEDSETTLYNVDYLTEEQLTVAYEVSKLTKAHKKYGFTFEYCSTLWNRIKNDEHPEEEYHIMTLINDGTSIDVVNHHDFHREFIDIEFRIQEIQSLLYDIEEEPEMSFKKFTRLVKEIEYNVSFIKDKISENYSFSTDNHVVSLYMLINKEYNL